jgi:hypothetical protein
MNKEVIDALSMLLHCALKDTTYETQKEQFNFVITYIEDLKKKLDKAIELLISSEYKQFLINEKDKETIKECWLRYIEQELDK